MQRGDPWVRARQATEEMEQHLAAIARLADERALAIRELLDGGLTRTDLARRLGVSPAIVTKILKRPVVANGALGPDGPDGHSPAAALPLIG
jgi:hypothetical protein